jgi:hypothetical protein
MDGRHVAVSVWSGIVGWVRQESAAATALVQAFIALGIAFAWWHWNNAQTGAVIGIVSALLGMFVRSQVTPLVRPRSVRNVPLAEAGPQPATHRARPPEAWPPEAQARPPEAQPRPPEARAPEGQARPTTMPYGAPPAVPPGQPPAGPAGPPPPPPPAG